MELKPFKDNNDVLVEIDNDDSKLYCCPCYRKDGSLSEYDSLIDFSDGAGHSIKAAQADLKEKTILTCTACDHKTTILKPK